MLTSCAWQAPSEIRVSPLPMNSRLGDMCHGQWPGETSPLHSGQSGGHPTNVNNTYLFCSAQPESKFTEWQNFMPSRSLVNWSPPYFAPYFWRQLCAWVSEATCTVHTGVLVIVITRPPSQYHQPVNPMPCKSAVHLSLQCSAMSWARDAGVALMLTSVLVFSTDVPNYDVVVVGGGAVGAATARSLSLRHPELKLALVEKESGLGTCM